MNTFKTRTVVLTGASSGIGKAIFHKLAQAEAFIHLVGRDEQKLGELVRQARTWGAEADAHIVDLMEDEGVEALIEGVTREVKGIDMLIHSAGMVSLGSVESSPIEDLDKQYRLNLRVPYLLTQRLLPLVKRAKGQIVFINSGAGLNAREGWSQYAASKHGLKALADSLREEVRADGVRVISIYPGRTASPMQEAVHKMEGKPYNASAFIQPDDVAQVILTTLSLPRTAAVTDVNIRPGQG